jgi:hypothetical protein
LPGSNEFDVILAVNRDVLFIASRFEEDRVALCRRIDGLLYRPEVTAPVQSDHNGPRSLRRSALRVKGSAHNK